MPDQKTLQGLFDLAQEKLVAKDYPAAKEALLKIKEEGYTSASVEASFARSLFESGDAGRAVVAWSNAIAMDRFNSTYRSDLALAQTKVPSNMGTKLEHPSEVAALLASYVRPKEQLFIGSLVVLVFIYLKVAGLLDRFSKASRILILFFAFLIL
jgi:hypothetical protein